MIQDPVDTIRDFRFRAVRAVFGDRAGLALFLGSLAFVTLTWRVGVFITDNTTLVHTLDALSRGRFWIEPAGSGALNSPGTSVREGLVYGRNYGQLVLSLPAVWAIRALDALVNLRVALLAGWHLVVLAFAVTVGRLYDRESIAAIGGGGFVLVSFVANVALVTRFQSPAIPLVALQVTAAIAAAYLGVVLYRLVASLHDTRLGILVGGGAVMALPIAFWATIPKRHVFTSLLVVGILWSFYRSRHSRGSIRLPAVGSVPAYRGLAYALVGLLTWIHAAEGLFVVLALLAVDLPTAPKNDLRSIGFVAAVFVLSLIPVLLTNLAVTGELARPPRAMSSGGSGPLPGQPSDSGGSVGGSNESLWGIVSAIPGVWIGKQVLSIALDGLQNAISPDVIVETFIHSNVEGIGQDDRFLGINLTMLEAAPLLGASIVALLGGIRTTRKRLSDRLSTTDVLALALVGAFLLLYMGKLPLNTQVTVRYLLPIYPLGVYLLVQSETVRSLATNQERPLVWSYCVGICIGGQLLLAFLLLESYAVAEATRIHALLGVGIGLAVAIVGTASLLDSRLRPIAAVTLGLAAAAGTVFFLLATVYYFGFVGEYVLPVVDAVNNLLAAAG